MERLRRVARFWNWLPAFRAVAETQHLPTAANELLVSAPALSRSVRLLEQDLGAKLFERQGRRIVLNDAGEVLLAAVRDAMRHVHEAVLHVQSDELAGPVYVASAGAITTAYVIPALQKLRQEHPELVPHVSAMRPATVVPQLLRGEIDVAFQSLPVHHSRLTTVRLGAITAGVYCGFGHPLFRKRKVRFEDVSEHEFVGPPPDAQGLVTDGWPLERRRSFGMHVDQIRIGLEVCEAGRLLGVFPDPLARAHGDTLRRLPLELGPPTEMYTAHRPWLGLASRASRVLEAVQQEIG